MLERSRWRHAALLAGFVIAAALAALYVARIGSDPPGLYDDEASIGYNAWTIVHDGTDQYGNHLPLFFVDFGDYKGPVATYLVAPFVGLFGNSTAMVRLPSVLAGIAIFLIAGRLAFVLTRSRGVALVTMVFTALQPWIFLQSHTMLEGNILMVLCVMLALWCIAEASTRSDHSALRWWSGAGAALGVSVFAYTVGRALAFLVAAAAALNYVRRGQRVILRFLFPVAVAYVILGAWALATPGGLFGRFQKVGLVAGNLSLVNAASTFVSNYATYFSPDFLLLKGDGNLRQTTGFGGVLLDATLPLMLLGAVHLVMRWREAYPRLILAGTVLAPVPAALTLAAPHALRGAGLIPFLVVLMIEGTGWLWAMLRPRAVLAITLAALVTASAAPYFVDFFTTYPARAALAFEVGEAEALRIAYSDAGVGTHALFLSASLNQPAMQLMDAIDAPPPQDAFIRAARITVVTSRTQLRAVRPGDVIVLGPQDAPPAGALLLFLVRGGNVITAPVSPSATDLLRVYRD
jgi:4-amino-4-deoxy-L-arabinose transferase-like glycosyltransferase